VNTPVSAADSGTTCMIFAPGIPSASINATPRNPLCGGIVRRVTLITPTAIGSSSVSIDADAASVL